MIKVFSLGSWFESPEAGSIIWMDLLLSGDTAVAGVWQNNEELWKS